MKSGLDAAPTGALRPERRGEFRSAARGLVQLEILGAERRPFSAGLLDYSATGFRAKHLELGLATGDKVAFKHKYGSGIASVAWCRVHGRFAQSGFRVLFGWRRDGQPATAEREA